MSFEPRDDLRHDPRYPAARLALAQVMSNGPFSRYGIHGIGVGRKVVGGRATDRLALRFHAARKIAPDQLPAERRIPPSIRVYLAESDREEDVPTDVVEAPPPSPSVADPESRLRPVPGGVSGYGAGSGTLGGWVWDHTDDTIVMLSNRHVLGNDGNAIIQPATSDGGQVPQDRIGQVKRGVPLVPIGGSPGREDCNYVDAAIGEADSSDLFDLTVLDIGPAVYDVDDPVLGDAVEKMGQTTGHTFGAVTDIDYNVQLPYPGIGDVALCDCFRVVPSNSAQLWGSFGDSGAIVFRQGGATPFRVAVGLHFGGGGTPPNNYGIACKVNNVFNLLDLGPLCEGGCAAFLDALYFDERQDVAPGRHRTPDVSPVAFTLRERRRQRASRFHTGLTRDLQERVATGAKGRGLLRFIDRHRGELLTLLVKDGDTRRATVAALRPIVAGAIITSDVLERRLAAGDIERLESLGRVLAGRGSKELGKSVLALRALIEGAEGRTVADILRIRSAATI